MEQISFRSSKTVTAAGLLGALAVIAGAFGAHALRESFTPRDLEIFETAVRYHLSHSIVLLVVGAGVLPLSDRIRHLAGMFFGLGILVFSGSLYLLVFTEIRKWGMVTPVGGLMLILGWLTVAAGGMRPKK